ncbi:MAG: NOB1 family endonuclease [Candidatus Nanohaloarchaea archaeon]
MGAVVDANVFLHGRGRYRFDKAFTVPEVVEEVRSGKGRNNLRNLDYSTGKPSQSSLEEVRKKSDEINSPTSDVDEKLLALARDIQGTLVTDDKALQNLAIHLDIDFEGYLEDRVEEKFEWEMICENCGRNVSGERCSSCGSTLLRRRLVRNS